MPKFPIDLGRKMGGPDGPMTASPSKEKYYPTLHLEWKKEYDLPESGTMVVTFDKTSDTKTTRDGDTKYEVTLEIKSIDEVNEGDDEEDTAKDKKSPGDYLDKLAEEAEAE